jgi:sulfatase modifying factor 1
MRSDSAVANTAVQCAALFAVTVVACVSSDLPGEDRQLPREYAETITSRSGEKISFEMVLIPDGTFLMGSPKDEPAAKDDEKQQHKVRLAPFYFCTTETTLELFLAYYQETMSAKKDHTATEQSGKDAKQNKNEVDAVTGPTPVYGDPTMGYGRKYPAIGMTWHNAKTFCEWLSRKTGRKYRLPTEAEWEYACRAGTTNLFGCTNDPNRLADFAWYETNSDDEPHEVGRKKPNAWRLYDMSGNVREWVSDFYSPEAYRDAAQKSLIVNPTGPAAGKVHVARGGDHRSSTEELRCAARAFEQEWWRYGDPQIPKSKWWLPQMDFIGFRIARSLDPNDPSTANQHN